jgi:hypothetical protein
MTLWLSLLISVAFVPGLTGASIPTGWAAMSLTLPLATWRRVTMTPIHWLGLVFLAYAFASVLWAPRRDDAINDLWHLTLFALAFILGSQLVDLRKFWIGMAIGVGISSAIALIQWWWGSTWQILPTANWGKPPGLFFNDAVAGAVSAIVFVGCAYEYLIGWSLLCLPLLGLSQSRGAWLAVAATYFFTIFRSLISWRERVIYLAFWAIPVGIAITYYHTGSDPIRLSIWQAMFQNLSWHGAGAGSSQTLFIFTSNQIFHIEHAHNDFLQLAYEFGIGCIPLALALIPLLEHTEESAWPPFVCACIISLYFWTLESPVTAFLFGVVAGRCAGSLGLAWRHGHFWGSVLLLRRAARRHAASESRREDVSVLMGPKKETVDG